MAQEALSTRVTRGLLSSTAAKSEVDTTGRDTALLSGLETLSTELKEIGEFERNRKVSNDIITAKTAFEMNRQLPGSLAVEAEIVYNNLVASKTTRDFLATFGVQDELTVSHILQNTNIPDFPNSETGNISKGSVYNDQLEDQFNRFLSSAGFNDVQRLNVQGHLHL